jgi:hypothetical protein
VLQYEIYNMKSNSSACHGQKVIEFYIRRLLKLRVSKFLVLSVYVEQRGDERVREGEDVRQRSCKLEENINYIIKKEM